MTEFFRTETQEEKQDFIELSKSNNFIKNFYKKTEIEEAKYVSQKKPFCARCAKLDFKDRIDNSIREAERKAGFVDFNKLEVKDLDLNQYAEESRFEYVKEQKAMEPSGRLDTGTVVRQRQIGIYHDYKCKVRGCKISIFIPTEEYANQENKTMSDTPIKLDKKEKNL